MKKMHRAGLAFLLAACATPVMAQQGEQEMRPYIDGGFAYTFADSDRNSSDGMGSFLGFGAAINQYWGWEVQGAWDKFTSDGASDPLSWRQYSLKLDGLFFYSRNPRFSPYASVGVGGAYNKWKNAPAGTDDNSTDPFVDAGFGFFSYFKSKFFDDSLGVRLDARYRWVDTDLAGFGSFGEPVVKLSLVSALGSKPVQAVAEIKDSDGDGVPDDADLCPGTAKGVKVDAKGCPVDSDGDGIPDGLDQCPGTAPGVAVDDKGCPTTLGSGRFKITGSGADLRFEDVHFEFDKSDLTDYAKEMLDDAANVINQVAEKYPGLKIDVSGHTDSTGTDGYNQGLSERRANAVKQYLLRKGVEPGRLNTYAYGESKPVATNDTEEGRAQNRRAETRTRGE